jgi:hypothetical protein
MKLSARARRALHAARALSWVAATLGASLAFAAAEPPAALQTADQIDIERQAVKVFNSPAVRKARSEATKLFEGDPVAGTPDGRASLREAVDEMVFASVYDAVDSDSAHPRILWIATPPHHWFDSEVPGARLAIDNPDNVYREVILDGAGSYEIRGRHSAPGPVQLSFQLYRDISDHNLSKLDSPLDGLLDRDIQLAADGSYTIVIDELPANGRRNHIRITPEAKSLLIRNTFSDWSTQNPDALQIRRLDNPAAAPVDEAQLVARAVERIKLSVPFWLKFNQTSVYNQPANVLPKLLPRGGGWGFVDIGHFQLGDDEALIVTVDTLGARYTGFQLTDPWGVSRDYIHHTGSLNITQATPNADGTYSYVIAARDPGVANWLDTGGLHAGQFAVRWQALGNTPSSTDTAVREVRLVKLSALAQALPVDVPRVTPAQRRQQLDARAAAFARRYTSS